MKIENARYPNASLPPVVLATWEHIKHYCSDPSAHVKPDRYGGLKTQVKPYNAYNLLAMNVLERLICVCVSVCVRVCLRLRHYTRDHMICKFYNNSQTRTGSPSEGPAAYALTLSELDIK